MVILKRYQSREFVCDSLGLKESTLPRHAITKSLREVTNAHWTPSAMNLWIPGCPACVFVSIWKNVRRPGRRLRLPGAARAQPWNWKWSAKEGCWSSGDFICVNDLCMFFFESKCIWTGRHECHILSLYTVIYIFYHLVSSTLQWKCAPCLPRP